MSFWLTHSLHAALVVVPTSAMAAGLLIERRRSQGKPVAHATAQLSAQVHEAPRLPTDWLRTQPQPQPPTCDPTPTELPLRYHHIALPVVAASATAAGLVHLVVTPQHFAESWLYGTFFLLAASLQILWAVVVTFWPSRAVLKAGGMGCGATMVLWVISRTVGIPDILGGGTIEPIGALDILATSLEAVAAIAAVVALRGPILIGGSPRSWPKTAKAIGVTMVCGIVAAAFLAPVG